MPQSPWLRPLRLPKPLISLSRLCSAFLFLALCRSFSLGPNQAILVGTIMVQFKNRYMIMEIFLDANKDAAANDQNKILSSNSVTKAIKDSIQLNFGECGLAISLGSYQLKYLNATTKICIIRTSREDHPKVWAAITLVRSVGNYPATFNLLDLSGNIRACKRAALKCEEARFSQYMLAAGEAALPDISKLKKELTEKINNLEG